jgi:hypothetical protein
MARFVVAEVRDMRVPAELHAQSRSRLPGEIRGHQIPRAAGRTQTATPASGRSGSARGRESCPPPAARADSTGSGQSSKGSPSACELRRTSPRAALPPCRAFRDGGVRHRRDRRRRCAARPALLRQGSSRSPLRRASSTRAGTDACERRGITHVKHGSSAVRTSRRERPSSIMFGGSRLS